MEQLVSARGIPLDDLPPVTTVISVNQYSGGLGQES